MFISHINHNTHVVTLCEGDVHPALYYDYCVVRNLVWINGLPNVYLSPSISPSPPSSLLSLLFFFSPLLILLSFCSHPSQLTARARCDTIKLLLHAKSLQLPSLTSIMFSSQNHKRYEEGGEVERERGRGGREGEREGDRRRERE